MNNIIHVGPLHCAANSTFHVLFIISLVAKNCYSLTSSAYSCIHFHSDASEMAFLLTGEFLCMFLFVYPSFE